MLVIAFVACNTSKQVASLKSITNGQNLEKVPAVSYRDFISVWAFNNRMQKIDLNTRKIYEDNEYTYFGKPNLGATKLKWTFFKISSDSINKRLPNYEEFYGSDLMDFLWSEVLPKEDIELWNTNRTPPENRIKANCRNKNNRPIHKYTLLGTKVILTMTWHIECEELRVLRDKSYKASYDLLSKKLEMPIEK